MRPSIPDSLFSVKWSRIIVVLVLLFSTSAYGQLRIVHIQPDALAAGMSISMELLAPASDTGIFGADGIYLPSERIVLLNGFDSLRIILGPVTVSWRGRLLQVPVMAVPSASTGDVSFQVIVGNKKSEVLQFSIVTPQPIFLNGDATIDNLTKGNTLVVESINLSGPGVLQQGLFRFSTDDPIASTIGNERYHPIFILARQSIILNTAQLSVSAEKINGGQAGGGGGGGFLSTGGFGYTGGGSDTDFVAGKNIGSFGDATKTFGGASTTGVLGGASVDVNATSGDQGGGGGTGAPFGSSGIYTSGNFESQPGGYGGASGGGETTGLPYGGGGGGFGGTGQDGAGVGSNGGRANGGRFLIPMQGGSGGGGGNALFESDSAGSGGGGGGAITIVAFDSISIVQSKITANGAFGTSGKKQNEAGGGGGSGGGIFLSARKGTFIRDQSTIETFGGNGGLGGVSVEQQSKGGAGSKGRVVYAGSINDTSRITGRITSLPTVILPLQKLSRPVATITGFAGSAIDLADSIRIYYRDRHSSWRHKDTVRFFSNGVPFWKSELPIGHDSQLFVTVFEKVKNPIYDDANYEPLWVTTHLSNATIAVIPSASLTTSSDTINFGTIPFDTCKQATLIIGNIGEEILKFDSLVLRNSKFHIIRIPGNITPYAHDSIIIEYCPDSTVSCDSASLWLYQQRELPKRIVVLGCGIDKDERISVTPSNVRFNRVHIGECKLDSVTIKVIGKDPVTISPEVFIKQPFEIVSPTSDVTLQPKDSLKLIVRFCPTDSGDFSSSFVLTHRRDSLPVSGFGTVRILSVQPTLDLGSLCPNECDSVTLTLSSLGNDSIEINGISNVTILNPATAFILSPHSDTIITIQYCSQSADSIAIATIESNSDSIVSIALTIHPRRIQFEQSGSTQLGPICLSSSDSSIISLHRIGADSLIFSAIHLIHNAEITISSLSSITDTATIHLLYQPTNATTIVDTIEVTISNGKCDSLIRIPIKASATKGGLVFTPSILDFGSVEVDSCKLDSIRVSLPCGADETVQFDLSGSNFSLVNMTDTIMTISSGTSRTILIRYCPELAKRDSFVVSTNNSDITILGTGLSQIVAPYIHITLDSAPQALADNNFSYMLSIDSLSGAENIRSLSAVVKYNPFVLYASAISNIQWAQSNGAERRPGEFLFTISGNSPLAKGGFATITVTPYLSTPPTTTVILQNANTLPPSIIEATEGSVTVVTCSDQSGAKSISSAYRFEGLKANPVTSMLSFEATLGTPGVLTINVYDITGALQLHSIRENELAGKHRYDIDVSSLPAGAYNLQLESWGWLGGSVFIIQH